MITRRCGFRSILLVFAALGLATIRWVDAAEWVYTVRPGDNLWSLTETHLTSMAYVQRLQTLNRVADPNHIPPGTRLRVPIDWLKQQPVVVKVTNVEGAERASAMVTGQVAPVKPGLTLAKGDRLRTGNDSSVVLEFADGSQLLVQPDSELEFETLQAYGITGMVDSRVNVLRGRVESRVKPAVGGGSRFEISTPAAVTAVRGTQYRVGFDDRTALAEVLEGKVGVSAERKTIALPEGFGTVAERGQPPQKPVPLLLAPDLSGVPAVVERVPLNLPFAARDGATSYRVQLAREPSKGSFFYDRVGAAAAVRGPDLADGEYLLRVRAIDPQGLEGENAEQRFRLNARPEPPALLHPAPESAVVDEKPGFSWAQLDGIKLLRLQVAADNGFTKLLLDVRVPAAQAHTSGSALPTGVYFWRVAAIDDKEGEGPFSDAQSFRRVPPGPAAEAPAIGKEDMVLSWRAGLPGQKYQVQMSSDKDFATTLVDERVGEPRLQIKRPDGGKYQVRIKTIDADGYEGPWGDVQTIDVPSRRSYWWLLGLPLIPLLL